MRAPTTTYETQGDLWENKPGTEDRNYLTRQLVSYLGNKRRLLDPIGTAVNLVKQRLGKSRLDILDAFSGSGVVSRFFKKHASLLISNDIEHFSEAAARCYLRNRSTIDRRALAELIEELNARVESTDLPRGFIEELYAPRDEDRITDQDRVYYTPRNARRLDNYRRLIEPLPSDMKDLLLGPLLARASIHSNTAGTFKGFFRNYRTGIGLFGGLPASQLSRIREAIKLEMPRLSRFECDCIVLREDANDAAPRLPGVDLAYIDPPCSTRPYGLNYFMLNLLTRYERPRAISKTAGLPQDWQRSGYNVRAKAMPLLRELLETLNARFLLVSSLERGIIPIDSMKSLLNRLGTVDVIDIPRDPVRTRRNLQRDSYYGAFEDSHLFLVERRPGGKRRWPIQIEFWPKPSIPTAGQVLK